MNYKQLKARKQEVEHKIKQLRHKRIAAQNQGNESLDMELQEQQDQLFVELGRVAEQLAEA